MSGYHSRNTQNGAQRIETGARQCIFDVESAGLSDLLMDIFPDCFGMYEEAAAQVIARVRGEAPHE
jgi:hypothetical protein